MSGAAKLDALREHLTRMGLVIAPHADRFVVRLPFVCSVRVRIEGEILSCEPYLGALPRTRATLFRSLGLTALGFAGLTTPAMWHAAPGAAGGVALLAVASWGYDALRYILTESAVAQIRQSFIVLDDAPQSSESRPALGATSMPRLAEAAQSGARPATQREPERARRPD
jgi:hypothetical protein